MARMTGGEAIVKALAREGVTVAFGLPGVQLYGIVTAFRDEPIRFITVRHEGSSTYMADGYARAGGGVGVAVAVPGPGLLNAAAGLNTAYSASSPVLMIAGQIPRNQIGKKIGVLHELDDQLDAIAGSTKWRQTIMQVADAPRIVHEAFGQLRSGRPRPVAIDMPWDTMEEEVDVTLPAVAPHPARAAAPAADIDRAAETLLRAQRVAIYAGGGVHLSGANAALAAVAEHLQAGVVQTAEGKGAVSDASDLSLGAGLFPKSPLRRYLDTADVVLAVGSRCAIAMFPPEQQVIQIDADSEEIGRNHKKTTGLVGDAKATLEALLDRLRAGGKPRASQKAEREKIREEVAGFMTQEPNSSILRSLRQGIPHDSTVIAGMTQMGYFSRPFFPVYNPRTYITSSYSGNLGFEYPTALGAKVATPNRPVVMICGRRRLPLLRPGDGDGRPARHQRGRGRLQRQRVRQRRARPRRALGRQVRRRAAQPRLRAAGRSVRRRRPAREGAGGGRQAHRRRDPDGPPRADRGTGGAHGETGVLLAAQDPAALSALSAPRAW